MTKSNIHSKIDRMIPSYPSLLIGNGKMTPVSAQGIRIRRKSSRSFRDGLSILDKMLRLNTYPGLTAIIALALLAGSAHAQNFHNTGTYRGSGTFHVRNLATGLPDTVSGTFDYFGANQTVDARVYQNLELNGASSVKQTAGTGLTVMQNATVAADVTLQVQAGDIMTLDQSNGRLTESGAVVGKVTKTVNLAAPVDSSDFGGIGLAIRSFVSPFGTTKITRTSGSSPGGIASIRRWYDINPANPDTNGSVIYFRYSTDELAGQNQATLDLWRSPDGGVTWRRQHTVRNANTLMRTARFAKGLWTASDASNLIGRSNYEFDPDSIAPSGADSLKGRINKVLSSPFIARITDVYGNPIGGTRVRFSIGSVPSGAAGYSLSDTLLTTDSFGRVSSLLKLGDRKGSYYIIAQVDSIPAVKFTFRGYAQSGVYAIAEVSGPTADTVKTVLAPCIVVARDDSNATVPYTGVRFSVLSPSGSTMQRFVTADSITDSTGHAQAVLQLGEKAGIYTIEARSTEDDSVVAIVKVQAGPGFPALAWKDNTVRRDTIDAVLPQFIYTVTDRDTNGVQGRSVRFVLNRPDGSIADSALVATDSLGQAKAVFRFGNRSGSYTVHAKDVSLPVAQEKIYSAFALPGKPAKMNRFFTSMTDTIGATLAPFGVAVLDRADNGIGGAMVVFSASGGQLVRDSIISDSSNGRATAGFSLGNGVGTYIINAHYTSLPDTQFVFTATHGQAQFLVAARGQNQMKPVSQALDSLFVARVVDRASNPIPNDTVRFAVTEIPAGATGYSISRSVVATDSQGTAGTLLTLGRKIGIYKVQGSSSRLAPIVFSAEAIHGTARTVVYESGNGQRKQILSWLDGPFSVIVRDVGNNPVPNIPVKFSVAGAPAGAWGYALQKDTVLADSLGRATTIFKPGSKIGQYTIVATSSSTTLRDTIRFNATALVGAANALAQQSGNGQVGQIGDRIQPFVVQVSDTGGNLVPNVMVSFATEKPDTNAMYDSLSASSARTDSAGMASTVLTLGNWPGRYTVRASVSGVRDTQFVADAILLRGDANHDNYLNIGDLTAIIDHILGRDTLKGYDKIRADMYPPGHPDGVIDIRDALVCRDSLLSGGWDPTRDWLQTYTFPAMKVSGAAATAGRQVPILISGTDSSYLQLTHIGSRFSLNNKSPIKGLQAVLYLKQPVILDTTDIVFPRAQMMSINVKSSGREASMVLWNPGNLPIDTGSAAIFRLPVKLSANSIDSMKVIVSNDTNAAMLMPWLAEDITNLIPRDWMLYQNYPNPFNPSTTIEFDVPEELGKIPRVAIQIFNILGQKVRTIDVGTHDAGRYRRVWNGTNEVGARVATGVYFYRLLAGDYVSTKKMIMLK
jgi:hypothetical protein